MLWIWQSEQVKFVNHENDIWNCGSWPEIKDLGRFGLKISMCPIFMKFGTQYKLNMLIINILIGIHGFHYKFAKVGPKTEICSNFNKI